MAGRAAASECPFGYFGRGTVSPDYPAVFSIWTDTPQDEARRFADMVEYLLKNKVISACESIVDVITQYNFKTLLLS